MSDTTIDETTTIDFDAFGEDTTTDEVTPAVTKPAKSKKPLPNATIRRQVDSTLRLAAMDQSDRTVVSQALGVTDDNLTETIVAFLVNPKPAIAAFDLLSSVALADPMEAAVVATASASDDRATFRAAWRILERLDQSLPSSVPSTPAGAGLALARVAQSTSADNKNTVRRLRAALVD